MNLSDNGQALLVLAGYAAQPGQGPSASSLSHNSPGDSGFDAVDVKPVVQQGSCSQTMCLYSGSALEQVAPLHQR
jgi:hypothetical protein